MNIAAFFDIQHGLAIMVLGAARIMPSFFLLPFFNHSVISNTIRMPVIMLTGLSLWPHPIDMAPLTLGGEFMRILAREFFIGLLLGMVFALPFWVMHGIGSVIDNQRGATISSTLDPVSGVDTSELANLFHLFAGVLFLVGGGLSVMLEAFARSYQLCDPLLGCSPPIRPVLGLLSALMLKVMVLASPVLAALLLSEILLGLLSRFAPQMNAFSISLTVKSMIAFFILLLYFSPLLPEKFHAAWISGAQIKTWLAPEAGSLTPIAPDGAPE
ncbi:type III secretion system export apparatus subunit SctT [Martelella alba]|uniref:SpaR/YscT/HrcT type III secretion system export apparatus protein n=1 Tax=Martelella alba TaxID=2590451 RepID=A0ABY2SN38_9HYPH|nr:type III secretion system export apparatus subunit SctT [Martelella alba]TKI05078.1 SpaR/YscT/HrcT type III secretion system export apparatus protein [Martelella alba]